MSYIPDMTERFPEGMNGVDLTDSYFGGYYDPYDYDDHNDYDEETETEPTETEPRLFEVGNEYRQVGIYGGVTVYKVEQINREQGKILLAEVWFDVDGSGTRPAKWHKLETDDNGNEQALEWTSKEFGDIWIYA